MTERDREFVARVKEALDAEAAVVDQTALERLRAIRRQAVGLAERKADRSWRVVGVPRWLTAGGAATVAVLVIAVSIWLAVPRGSQVNRPVDFEILTAKEHLEVYEDLDFYQWLAMVKPAR